MKWISVKEQEPTIGPVLIYLPWCHEIRIARLTYHEERKEKYWKDDHNYTYNLDEHPVWYPLPDMPKDII